MTQRYLENEDYTVGWICALPVELAAASELLDEEHGNKSRDPNDSNSYTLGRIGDHNVAVACLPAGQIGTNPAATVATQMRLKFTSIRFGLMVGIGGGVPSTENAIRLGDVVICQPQSQHGGVVQYDMGKTGIGGRFSRTGSLNTPPALLLATLAQFKADQMRGKSKHSEYLSKLIRLPDFQYPGEGTDVLYSAVYDHRDGPTCDQCDRNQGDVREPRRNSDVVFHYGTIASGNQVVKDGNTRDQLSSDLGGVLCFEMEAAGLMNSFPCLVIRGICDYADSHKNKKWQPYAAATAAACAKEILNLIPAAEVAERPSAFRPRARKGTPIRLVINSTH